MRSPTDGDVALEKVAGDEIEHPAAFEHDVRLVEPLSRCDGAGQKGDRVAH